MKASRLVFMVLLLLSAAAFQLPAQQTETDRNQFEAVKAKAEAGDAKAEFQLSTRYHHGDGIPQDYVEAVKWYRKAAEQNEGGAELKLGLCYYTGDGASLYEKLEHR